MSTSTKAPAPRRPQRSIPMPLWLQGVVELAQTALYSLLAVFILLFAVWVAGGFDNRDVLSVAGLSAQIWQLIHGVPLNLDIPVHGAFDAISGTISLIPLGLTLIPLALCFRSGRRLAQASYEGQFWVPTVAGALAYMLISVLLSLFVSGEYSSTNPLLAALVPCWVVLLGVIGGGWYESRSLARMIGVNAAEWVSKFSQYSRWAGSYVWTVVKSSFVALLGFIAAGALLFTLAVFYNWNDILALYQNLHAGAIGDTAITLLQLGFIPNFVVWAMAWSTGAGFSFGTDTAANLQVTDLGALPALPILGAMPVPVPPFSFLALLAPILAGALAGWWFFRAGENHFDEWLSLKIRFRWITWPLSTLLLAVAVGLLTGVWTALIGWLAHGSLGLGRFTDIGPHPLWMGLMTAAWIALGVVLGFALAPLLEKDATAELERFADTDARAEKARRKKQKAEDRAARKKARAEAKKQKKSEGAVETSQETETALETGASEENEATEESASVLAMRRIFSDEVSETVTSEPASVIALPWNDTDGQPEQVADEQESVEEPAPESEPEPRQQKLKRGRVISRPKARKNQRGS
ncbi:cell division protein PerM [Rothia aerolata]|uniref:Uncharacterized protein n=1 Tax=Rothia aerolata TaxID=1812262 RepID=A0A917IT77_9MICC|nr:DUF6350 family protein [Rothia aerolata]GGH62573.1 hypothetical protein GCM10007359_12940 [Rothia aerolata]